jgi:hypothetical protein
MDHQLAHINDPRDENVKWTIFEKTTKKDYFGYKLLPSDKCLLVARIENGAASTQWLRDPYHPAGPETASAAGSSRPRFEETLEARVEALRAALQSQLHFVVSAAGSDVEPSWDLTRQAQGACLNPHPWPYQEVWGAYVNQCQQPVYRQWNDGCRHVQLFDHCANAWGPVVWQVCVPNHHP